jgi:hypothetical protein
VERKFSSSPLVLLFNGLDGTAKQTSISGIVMVGWNLRCASALNEHAVTGRASGATRLSDLREIKVAALACANKWPLPHTGLEGKDP